MTQDVSAVTSNSRDRYLAYVSYQLGFAGIWFPIMAQFNWENADLERDRPTALLVDCHWIINASKELVPLIQDGNGQVLQAAVQEMAEEAWESWARDWGNPDHRTKIEQKNAAAYPEFLPTEYMLKGSPFDLPVWEELRFAIESFSAALPREVAMWVRLGAGVAGVFDFRADENSARAIALLQKLLSDMQPQSLLKGLTFDPRARTIEAVENYHKRVLERLIGNEQEQGESDPRPPLDCAKPNTSPDDRLAAGFTKEVLALALLARDPGMPVREIAKKVGCSRQQLYRYPRFKGALAVLRKGARDLPRDAKSRDEDNQRVHDGVYEREPGEQPDE